MGNLMNDTNKLEIPIKVSNGIKKAFLKF